MTENTSQRLRLVAAALALALVASCSPEERDKTTVQLPKDTGNAGHDALMKVSPAEQAEHLGHMIPEGCQGVRAFFMGISKEMIAEWSVQCSNGVSYNVGIENDAQGTTNTIDCRVLNAVANVDCFVTFDAQKGRPGRSRSEFMCAISKLPPALAESAMTNFYGALREYAQEGGEDVPDNGKAIVQYTRSMQRRWSRECNVPSTPTAKRAAYPQSPTSHTAKVAVATSAAITSTGSDGPEPGHQDAIPTSEPPQTPPMATPKPETTPSETSAQPSVATSGAPMPSSKPVVVAASSMVKLSGSIPKSVSNDPIKAAIKVCVDDQGSVTSARVLKPATGSFDDLQQALLTWRYKPAVNSDHVAIPACFLLSLSLGLE